MKDQIRKEKLAWRKSLGSEKAGWDKKIGQSVDEMIGDRGATVLGFSSVNGEVSLKKWYKKILKREQVKLFFPRVLSKEKMRANQVNSLDELIPGFMGILEPPPGNRETTQFDFILIPGLAFNERRHRVGYGAGHFDRFLRGCAGKKIGVFYSGQKADFQEDSWDIPLDSIITEEGRM